MKMQFTFAGDVAYIEFKTVQLFNFVKKIKMLETLHKVFFPRNLKKDM